MSITDQVKFYESKLQFEMDPSDLFQAIESGEKFVPLDARREEGFLREHIPGAISFPYRTMDEESTKRLDREVTYVVYCDGIGCNASTRGSLKLAKLGFKVKELIGGIEWWKFDGYATVGTAANANGRKPACYC